MKNKLLFAALFLLLINLVILPQGNSFVTVKGKDIIAPDGKPVLLKGINLGNWLVPEGYMFKFDNINSPMLINGLFSQLIGPDETRKFWNSFRDNYITKKDIEYIKNLGLNSIRVPFNYRLFCLNDDPTKLEGPGYEMLSRVVKWCSEVGLYVILDMHCAPGGQTGDNIDDSYGYPFLFENHESQLLTAEIWKKIAARFSSDPIVIGYDLLNEPIATYFDKDKLNPFLEPLYKKIVKAIREVDANHIMFLGGAQWNNNFSVFGPPFDSKTVYTFHKYWCDTTQAMVQEYVDFSNKYNVPLWMGESGENTDEWVKAWRLLQERNNISWCFWPYKKLEANSCPVTFKKTPEYDSVIAFSKKVNKNFADVRANRPSIEVVRKALDSFLENCKFENCTPNEGYINALLKP